ncbi:biotin/lipoyl-binding carrier protein [Achromobacter pestifer]|uniref:Biotin/lipoyl-binding carrier protein n=1 Tax=Achromobacter pestifer TaxID=1353889 RepID=A0A7D4E0U2_9BURK|nr:biotin/lipoyl-binding carrier protein [Achromobacter pestifer]QKH37487.1 biotin/lipoyl-binding carrier protein [Achromobacter pestifer]
MSTHEVRSEIAGSVWKIAVAAGARVAEGDVLVILESMKMEIPVTAPRSGVVADIRVAEGQSVEEDQVVVMLGESA